VYTPPFLASLLLDYAMPYNSLTGNERLLDPSCGSGVFLVGAFKRLVNVWRAQNEWRRPEVTTLKKIMKQSIAYKDKIVGIHAPGSKKNELKKIFTILQTHKLLCQCLCALHGSQALAGKATAIQKQDIDKLPISENSEDFELAFWEKVLENDVLDYMQEYVRIGQNSDLLLKVADKTVLQNYTELFIRMIICIYENIKASDPVFINGLVCQPFYFGEKPALDWLSKEPVKELRKLIYKEDLHKSLRTIRVLRYYSENVLFIIKPDRLRYWIGSTAIRDADDTLVDLRKQGY
jgi:hypothetical protein